MSTCSLVIVDRPKHKAQPGGCKNRHGGFKKWKYVENDDGNGSGETAVGYNRSAYLFSLEEENHMRMLLRVSIPVEAGNAAAKAGTLGSTVERILADLKPEAAYFFVDDSGQRSGAMVFDMKDPSQIPGIAEPWFLAFNAKVWFRPVMNPQDLAKAGPSIAAAAGQYGK
jgi:hypothetical protein